MLSKFHILKILIYIQPQIYNVIFPFPKFLKQNNSKAIRVIT